MLAYDRRLCLGLPFDSAAVTSRQQCEFEEVRKGPLVIPAQEDPKMEPETNRMVQFSRPLIHFYLVPPTSRLLASDSRLPPEQFAARPSRLTQRWTRRPDGTLAARWTTI